MTADLDLKDFEQALEKAISLSARMGKGAFRAVRKREKMLKMREILDIFTTFCNPNDTEFKWREAAIKAMREKGLVRPDFKAKHFFHKISYTRKELKKLLEDARKHPEHFAEVSSK